MIPKDVIFARATAAGRAAIAVVRVSGPGAGRLLQELTRAAPPERGKGLRRLMNRDGELLDEAIVLWFEGPRSYTGDDLFELHLHGGAAVVEAVTSHLADLGARPADPGEFTRRAFEAGKLDLVQAEAIADLVDAETEAQRRQALRNLEGGFGAAVSAWRAELVEASALFEAQIDFPDEEIPGDVLKRAQIVLQSLQSRLSAAALDTSGERVRQGFQVVLSGAPNAGKSSLLNALSGREAAIVSDLPGTTRDVVEAQIVLDGYKVVLRDTAGLRESADPVEREGVRRARAAVDAADLVVRVSDGRFDGEVVDASDRTLTVATKADLRTASEIPDKADMSVSIYDQASIAGLKARIAAIAAEVMGGASTGGVFRQRHREMLGSAAGHIGRALVMGASAPELAAEDLRLAQRDLERIVGRIGADEVLGAVFSTFCIGK